MREVLVGDGEAKAATTVVVLDANDDACLLPIDNSRDTPKELVATGCDKEAELLEGWDTAC